MNDSRIRSTVIAYFFLFLVLNYAIFSSFSFLFAIPKTGLYYALFLLIIVSHSASLWWLKYSSGLLPRALYAVSAAWLGMSIYILIMLAIYYILGSFVSLPTQTAGLVAIVAGVAVSAYALFNVTKLEVEEINIPLDVEEDIRAVQLSDVHLGPIRKERFIRGMVDKVVELNPDIVFITGDLFDGSSKLPDDILKDFNRIKSPVLFVMGNHDFYQGQDEISNFTESTPINILYGVFNFKGIQVVGVPFSFERGYLQEALKKIEFDGEKPTILLYHLPSEFKTAKDAGVDLQLTGHTHAGQFFPFNYLVRLPFPLVKGLYGDQGGYLYVSQGTGTLGPPMRLGSRCEITLINISNKKGS